LGTQVTYIQSDISKRDDVDALIHQIEKKHGALTGIIHAAGLIHDNYIIKKSVAELQEVMAPKVSGLYNLDEATQKSNLSFVILFSSLAGVFGNPGQVDYSLGNAFMDAYAVYRNTLVEQGERKGRTLSINWPLWAEGGMVVDASVRRLMEQNYHILPLPTKDGIEALEHCIQGEQTQYSILYGHVEKITEQILT